MATSPDPSIQVGKGEAQKEVEMEGSISVLLGPTIFSFTDFSRHVRYFCPSPFLFLSQHTQALFQRAQSGEKEAVEALQDEFTKRHYTGTSTFLLSFPLLSSMR